MTRHIKFMSYWIKTTTPHFTFTIIQKDTNNKLKGQLNTFYMRMKNETSTIKNSKGGILGAYPYNFLKSEKPKIWEDKIVLIKLTVVRTVSP